eukprot:4814715-Alexandrium_andersonii.AAC.1
MVDALLGASISIACLEFGMGVADVAVTPLRCSAFAKPGGVAMCMFPSFAFLSVQLQLSHSCQPEPSAERQMQTS